MPFHSQIYGQLYYIPFYFLSVRSYRPLRTGVAILPVIITLVPSSILTGAIVTRTGNYCWAIWFGWVSMTIGSALTITFGQNTPTASWSTTLIVLGLGHGVILNAQNFAAQAMSRSGNEGHAAAMYAFIRQFGMALSVEIGGTIFQNIISLKLIWGGLDTAIARNSKGFIAKLTALPDGDDFKDQVLHAYLFGLRGVYSFYACISFLAFCLSLFCKQFQMKEEVESIHVLDQVTLSRTRFRLS